MAAAPYTPGPWKWSDDGNNLQPVNKDPNTQAVHTITDGLDCYGYALGNCFEAEAEQKGNRVLIEQAPVLFETLRGLLKGTTTKGEAADLVLAILGRLHPEGGGN